MLQDIAALTGAQVVSPDVGLKLDQVGLEVLGTARRIVVTKDDTTIVDGGGDAAEVSGRVAQIKAEIENTDSDWDREKLQERLAKLAGGVCVIKVGAATEVELKEKKHRIEDAVSATRAAIEEGIVAGGGSALVHAAQVLDDGPRADRRRGRPASGSSAARSTSRCAGSPRTAATQGYVVVAKVREAGRRQGLQRRDRRVRRPGRPGVIDPVKVTRSALLNAASIAANAADDRDAGRREARRTRSPTQPAATATGTGTDPPRQASSRREARWLLCSRRVFVVRAAKSAHGIDRGNGFSGRISPGMHNLVDSCEAGAVIGSGSISRALSDRRPPAPTEAPDLGELALAAQAGSRRAVEDCWSGYA